MSGLLRRTSLLAFLALPIGSGLADPPAGRGGGQGGGGGRGQGGGPDRGQGGPSDQGRGQGRGNGGGASGQGRGGPQGFGSNDSVVIRNWQAANPGWSPRPLPPGQMRQLARGKPLPPGIARQALPPGLVSQLPVYPGHSYAMVGTSVVLLGAGGVVVDIIAGLF